MDASPHIARFEPGQATDADVLAHLAFRNRLRSESLPDDPPLEAEDVRRRFDALAREGDRHALWIARGPDGELAAVGSVSEDAQLPQQAVLGLEVLPERRRRGLGRRLLRALLDEPPARGRKLLSVSTYGGAPAGEAFLRGMGAKPGLVNHVFQLDVREADRALIAEWAAEGPRRAPGLALERVAVPYPDAELAAIGELLGLIDDAPRGSLEVGPQRFTPERLRREDASLRERGGRRWLLRLRDEATGTGAGFRKAFWDPRHPWLLSLYAIAVHPDYRGRGLGRWLEAAMVDTALRECPEARFLRGTNAESNAPMTELRRKLGFRPYMSYCAWQLDMSAAKEFAAAAR